MLFWHLQPHNSIHSAVRENIKLPSVCLGLCKAVCSAWVCACLWKLQTILFYANKLLISSCQRHLSRQSKPFVCLRGRRVFFGEGFVTCRHFMLPNPHTGMKTFPPIENVFTCMCPSFHLITRAMINQFVKTHLWELRQCREEILGAGGGRNRGDMLGVSLKQ